MQHCEDQFLAVALRFELCSPRPTFMSLEDTLRSHDQARHMMVGRDVDYARIAAALRRFLEAGTFPASALSLTPCIRARRSTPMDGQRGEGGNL